jgi:hypothetical protein
LEHNGVRCYTYELNSEIGGQLHQVIDNALGASNFVVLLASQAALASQWVDLEIRTTASLEEALRCRLLPVRIGVADLPPAIRERVAVVLDTAWTPPALNTILDATRPNIYRNGWACRVFDFAGRGGMARWSVEEEATAYYRLKLSLNGAGAFSGVSWELVRGAVDVAGFATFSCMLRSPSRTAGALQLKFETQNGWAECQVPFPPDRWTRLPAVRLRTLGSADWSRLERVTVAVDDRDVDLGREHTLDVGDFWFQP